MTAVRRGKNGAGEFKLHTFPYMNDLVLKASNEEIEDVYQAYPRHIGKRDAIKAIEKAIQRLKDGEYKGRSLSRNEAIAGLKNRAVMFSESPAGKRGTFTAHPATWFNRSSYLDDPKEWEENGEASKTEQRIGKNRAAILAGLGLSGRSGPDQSVVQGRVSTRRS